RRHTRFSRDWSSDVCSSDLARYQFVNRGKHAFPEGFAEHLREAVNQMAALKLSKAEKHFFSKTCPYIDPTYFDFLQGYQYDPERSEERRVGRACRASHSENN